MSAEDGWVDNISAWRPGLRLRTAAERRPRAPRMTRADLVVGGTYSRRQIHEALGGPTQEYLPHAGGRVVCGCFKLAENPEAPRLVLPADGPNIQRWGRVFAAQTEFVPVFLLKLTGGSAWEYVGDYRVAEVIDDPTEVARLRRAAGRPVPFVLVLELREPASE